MLVRVTCHPYGDSVRVACSRSTSGWRMLGGGGPANQVSLCR
jgi:hypothetical protein